MVAMPPPSLIGRLSSEQQRLVFGLETWLFSDLALSIIAVLALEDELRGSRLPGIAIFGAFLAVIWWKLLPAWLELRPPGAGGVRACALTAAANLLAVAALVATLAGSAALGIALGALALVALAARVVVGVRHRAEQRRRAAHDARDEPPARR